MESFAQFLLERDLIPKGVSQRLSERQFVREPIGMIAVGHGLLTPMQIDQILDCQRERRDRFGEIAISLGFLTAVQAETLIKIQEFRTSAEIAEALALAQIMSIEEAAQYLGAFLIRDREVMEMVSDD